MGSFFFKILFLIALLANTPALANNPQDSIAPQTEKIVRFDTDSEVLPFKFNDEIIEGYQNDPAFNYTEIVAEENWWSQFKHWLWGGWLAFWNWLLGDYEAGGFVAFIIQILPYIIVFGILVFIVWLFFKLNPGAHFLKTKEIPTVFFSEEEEIIKRKNIRELIQKALANKDYRLAVRYYYLLILKNLSAAEIISYEFDKTNNDYIAEIKSENINSDFKKATVLYDYIWYGNFAVTETDYNKAQKTFFHLEQQIPKTID